MPKDEQNTKETPWIQDLRNEFKSMREAYDHDDQTREQVIGLSREIIRPAKQAIYAAHRGELQKANDLLQKANDSINAAHKLMENSHLNHVGSFRAGIEEYIEAVCYVSFLSENCIPLRKDLNLPFLAPYETYLLALSDFTGELVRRAVAAATKDDFDTIKNISMVCEELYGLFLHFNFRSSELRKKSDTLKYNLAKIQSIVYDIHLKR